MSSVQRLPAEAKRLEPSRRVAVDEDVGPGGEPGEGVAALRAFDVEGEAALVGVQIEEEAASLGVRLIVGERTPASCRVAVRWLLDLDDVGAHVGEELAAVGAGDHACELDDLDAFECSAPHGTTLTLEFEGDHTMGRAKSANR